jgi:hypothetical protein
MLRQLLTSGCLGGLLLLAAPVPGLLAADTARDHYLAGAKSGGDGPEWIGTRTSVILRRGVKEQAEIHEVGEGADFHSGDRFRIRLQTNDDGYAYLLVRANDNSYRMLYPAKGAAARSYRFRAFEAKTIPGRAKDWMAFDNKPAIEGLYLFFSAKPLEELETVKQSGTMSKSAFDELMSGNGQAKFMRFDEPEEEGSGIVPSTYYVERRASGRDFLVRPIDLVHRNKRQGGGDQ